MKITTNIKQDNNQKSNTVLDKFFQFMVLNEVQNDKCQVVIYTAIAFHCEQQDAKLIVNFSCNGQKKIDVVNTDKCSFYSDEAVLKQFWGGESKVDSGYMALIDKCADSESTEDKEILRQALQNVHDSEDVLYISENKESIKDIIIQPLKVKIGTNEVVLKCKFSDINKELKKYLSNGYWIKTVFEEDIESDQQGFKIEAGLELTGATFLSPDFNIYVQTPKKYDLKSGSVEINLDGENTSQGELIKVFSQSKINYFEEWTNLGIYASSLFKVTMNSTAKKDIFKKGIKGISHTAHMEDLDAPRKREINLLIFSILLSLFCAIGLDRTRQNTEQFVASFPNVGFMSIDLIWAGICIGIMFKYFVLKGSKIAKNIKGLLLLPFTIWFCAYFFIDIGQLKEIEFFQVANENIFSYSGMQSTLYILDIILSLYCIVSLSCIRYLRRKLKPNNNDLHPLKKRIYWIFGV